MPKVLQATTEINENVSSLYMICLQYYGLLKEKDHPKIFKITEILDELIELKKGDLKDEMFRDKFFEIHKKAYENIEYIYEFDRIVHPPQEGEEQDKTLKIKIEEKDINNILQEIKDEKEKTNNIVI